MSKRVIEHPVRVHSRSVAPLGDVSPTALISAGANFTLLGGKFMAAFEKKAAGYSILVIPTDVEARGMSISEIVADINSLISGTGASVDQADIEGKLKDLAESSDPEKTKTFDVSKLSIRLRQLFLYYQSDAESKTEYAFSLEVDASECFGTKLGIVGLDNVFFSIWNTDRKSILDRMKIIDTQSYLAAR